MPGEFNLIEKYLANRQNQRKDVDLALGDDCALVQPPENARIAISTDTLVAGTHFLPDAKPEWVAHKALASNLSDLAAMGATPAWVSMALTMPEPDESWLEPFCDSFFALADYYSVQLIGGDTTKGPLSITLTVQGFVPRDRALCRDGAKVGDWIYVTGNLGESKAGLDIILDQSNRDKPFADKLEQRHYMSTPRILAGQSLLNLASACVDISDGLLADLSHILHRSDVGAVLNIDALPVSEALTAFCGSHEQALKYALTSGEEYELCFTVPEAYKNMLEGALAHTGTQITCIGQIRSGNTLELLEDGEKISDDQQLRWLAEGYEHFKG
jgi:thiamine-monophosphate kinase